MLHLTAVACRCRLLPPAGASGALWPPAVSAAACTAALLMRPGCPAVPTGHLHVGMHMEPGACMCCSGVVKMLYAMLRHATQGAAEQTQTGTAASTGPPTHDALQMLAASPPSYMVPSPMHRSNPLYAQSPPAPAAAAPPPLRPAGLTLDASVGHTSCHAAAAQHVAVRGCRASPCGMSFGVGVCRCSSACSSCVLLLLLMRANSAAAMPAQQQCRMASGQAAVVLEGQHAWTSCGPCVHGCCPWCCLSISPPCNGC